VSMDPRSAPVVIKCSGVEVSAALWDLPARDMREKEASKNVRVMGKGTGFSLKNK
jgi:hypothetical protein